MDKLRYIDERFERLIAALMKLPPGERVNVLGVVTKLHAIKMERRAATLRYPAPKNCGLVWPPSPPTGPSTYTPRKSYPALRLIHGGRKDPSK